MARAKIAAQLRLGEVDDDELCVVLSDVLPLGAQLRNHEVEYRTMADDVAVTLEYQAGNISQAFAGPAWSAEIESALIERIGRDLMRDEGSAVFRKFCFSGRRVEGSWRYRKAFQIVPAPPDAPRPAALHADHPFLLDFAYKRSSNGGVVQLRQQRAAYELTLILDLLLRPRISMIATRAQHHWILHSWNPSAEPHLQTDWLQEGYYAHGFNNMADALPEFDGSQLSEVETDHYFNLLGNHRADKLTVPDRLAELLDRYGSLADDEQKRFMRSCYWYHMAGRLWDVSQSLHLVSLVNAIECLANDGIRRDEPEGPTGLFLDFMKRFAPGDPSKSLLNRIYDARSHVTHGETLFHYDQPPQGALLSQGSANDRDVGDAAVILCRGALINWLWNHENNADPPLLTEGLRSARREKPGTKSGFTVMTFGG